MAIVIGLTGSIASGKSTISAMFEDYAIPVIDADKLAREVVEPGEKALEKIVEAFGEEILAENGTLNRKKLGSIIFANEEKREQLNYIVHPAVRKRMTSKRDRLISDGERAVVLDIPLLFESELTHYVDKTMVVYVTEKTQLKRLRDRDHITEKEAMQRINAQISVEKKASMADAVINNNGSVDNSRRELQEQLTLWGIV